MCSNASTSVYIDSKTMGISNNFYKYKVKTYNKKSQNECDKCAEEIWQRIVDVDTHSTEILLSDISERKGEIVKAVSGLLKKWKRGYVKISSIFTAAKSLQLGLLEKAGGDKLILASSRDGNGTPIEIGIKIHGVHKLNTNTDDDGIEITFLRKF